MKALKIMCIVLAGFIVFISPVLATTFYVKTDGSDSSNGLTWATAFKTIQKGVNTAANGDTIDVNTGTYTEALDFSPYGPGKTFTLTSTNPDNWDIVSATIINGNGATNTITSDTGSSGTVTGFTVIGGTNGIYCTSGSQTVSKCIVRNNSDIGIKVSNTSTSIKNCIVKDNTDEGIYINNASSTVINSLVYDNDDGISFNTGALTVYNCTIIKNTNYGINKTSGTSTINSCILWGNSDDLSGCSSTYSCIEDGDAGIGNISSDPCFIDFNNDNYRLRIYSPCLDTGDPCATISQISSFDLYQMSRFVDGDCSGSTMVDMGCIEKEVIDVKQPPYNATGDGETDDFNAIQNAINDADSQGKTILLHDGIFAVNSMINLKTNTQLIGKNATIKNIDREEASVYSDPLIFVYGDCYLKGLIVDGNDKALNGIEILSKNNVTIQNCYIKNFTRNGSNVYGINVRYDSHNIVIKNCRVENVNSDTCSRAIMVGAMDYTMTDIVISDCNFKGIHATNHPYDDGDAIHASSYNPDVYDVCDLYYWGPLYITITDCCFSDFSKRGIKLQCSNATATNCYFSEANCTYFAGAAINIFGSDTIIKNNKVYFQNDLNAGPFGLYHCDGLIAQDNIIVMNPNNNFNRLSGFYLEAGPHDNTITGNQIKGCKYGLSMWDPIDDYPYAQNNTFTDNIVDISISCTYQWPADPNNVYNNTLTPNILPWSSSASYVDGDKVLSDDDVYECIADNTNQQPPNVTYWEFVKTISW